MPGLLGSASLTPAAQSGGAAGSLLPGLCSEPNYVSHPFSAGTALDAAIFAPAWSPYALRQAQGLPSVAIYGEAFLDNRLATGVLADSLESASPDQVESVLSSFDGSWCGLVWWNDLRAGALFVDHCASKPLYYAVEDGRLWFAPEPKALRRVVRTTLDVTALASYLTIGHVLNDQTLYGEVRSLEPGAMLRFDQHSVRKQRYFEYALADAGAPDEGEAAYVDRLHHALHNSVLRRRDRLPEAVIPISGGWDSRGLLAYAGLVHSEPLKTVSWGVDEDDSQADAAIGRRLAQHFGTAHRFLRRDPNSLPDTMTEMVGRADALTTDPALHYQEVEFMRRIRDEMDVRYLLRGDEVFGYMAPVESEPEALARLGIRRMEDYPDLLAALRPEARGDLSRRFSSLLDEISAACPLTDYTARKDYHYFYQRMFNYLHKSTYYKQTVLDIANPWLDRSILSVNAQVPVRYRVDKDLYKKAITTHFPDLRVPFAARHSLEHWPSVLSGNERVRSFLNDHLRERNSPLYSFLSPDRIIRMLDALEGGRQSQSARVRAAEILKQALMKISPTVYHKVRRRAVGKVRAVAMSPVDLLVRALTLKIWFDLYAPARSADGLLSAPAPFVPSP